MGSKIKVDERILKDAIKQVFEQPEWAGPIAVRLTLPEIHRRCDQVINKLKGVDDDLDIEEYEIKVAYQRMLDMTSEKYGV